MRAHIPSSIRRILRSVESQTAFLRCRGLEVREPPLPDVYARFLVERTFCSCGARIRFGDGRSSGNGAGKGPDRRGYDARDPAGVRYRVVGRKLERRSREVVVPGVPRRGFDRLVLVRFDSAYHVLFAGMTPAVDFLRASEYREDANEWALPLWSPFWSGEGVQDITDVFRAAAAQVALEDTPFVEPWHLPRAAPVRPSHDLRPVAPPRRSRRGRDDRGVPDHLRNRSS